MNAGDEAEGSGDKASTYEVGPKLMPGNPRRDKRGDGGGEGEMFGAEGGEWRGVEKRTEEEELVETWSFLPIAAQENDHEADDENGGADGGRPNHCAGNGEDEGWSGAHEESLGRIGTKRHGGRRERGWHE